MNAPGFPWGPLLAAAGISLLGANARANRLNQYDDALNAHLQSQGAQPLNFGHRNFYFGSGDADLHKGLADAALKTYQYQQGLNDQNTLGQKFGLPMFHSMDVAKETLAPYNTQDAQTYGDTSRTPGVVAGGVYANSLQNPDSNPAPPQATPSISLLGQPVGNTPGGTPLWDNTPPPQPTTLAAGATMQQLPPMPPGAIVTPAMWDSAGSRVTTERGQDMTARTAAIKEQREARSSALRDKQTQLQTKKIEQEIKNIQQIMTLRPKEAQARIANLARKTGAPPNAISMMLASGKSSKEIGTALFNKLQMEGMGFDGMDTGAPSSAPATTGGGIPSFGAWQKGKK